MSCGHCSKRVEEALKSVEGVKSVKVDLKAKNAEIILNKDIENDILKNQVEDLGFIVMDIFDKNIKKRLVQPLLFCMIRAFCVIFLL